MIKINEVPTDTLITFKLVGDNVFLDREIINKIIGYIKDYTKENHNVTIYEQDLISQINWTWKSAGGTLPTCIRKFMYEHYTILNEDTNRRIKYKLPREVVSQIGNIAREDLVKEQEYYFDISTDFEWRAGEFGDQGSCFFDDDRMPNHSIKKMRDSGNFKVLRFFHLIPSYKAIPRVRKYYDNGEYHFIGMSRCWMYKPSNWDDKAVIFNGYGLTTKDSAQILSHYTGTSFKKVSLNADIYINGDGYMIGNSKNKDRENVYMATSAKINSLENEHGCFVIRNADAMDEDEYNDRLNELVEDIF